MRIPATPTPPGPGPDQVDVSRLVAALAADPRPRLTWYGPQGARVELTGRVLAQWVAKTAHLLQEEADVAPGCRVRVSLGPDWRAPVLWLAAWYLGADVHDDGAAEDGTVDPTSGGGDACDVHVVREGSSPQPGAVGLVVAAAALPGPVADLPPGAVDYGAEVSAQPDQPPAPGPAAVLRVTPGRGGRVLLGPPAAPATVLAAWAAEGSVVLHTGLDGEELARVAAQENVSTG